jgi:hypothetical protein
MYTIPMEPDSNVYNKKSWNVNANSDYNLI